MRINQFLFLHGVRDSNPRPSVLETDILPTKLTPCVGYVCNIGILFTMWGL